MYVLSRSKNNIRIFYLKIFIILVVKFSIYLNRRVFVMQFNEILLALWLFPNFGHLMLLRFCA